MPNLHHLNGGWGFAATAKPHICVPTASRHANLVTPLEAVMALQARERFLDLLALVAGFASFLDTHAAPASQLSRAQVVGLIY